jgi:hypothetical protein
LVVTATGAPMNSTPLFWLEMAILIVCVALSIRMRSRPAMWVALGTVAHFAIWLAMHDEEILIRLIAGALVYLGLLKLSPYAARVWLCAGGALAGAFLLGVTAFSVFMSFSNRWSLLGLSIGATLLFLVCGLLIGFWVVYRWTAPAERVEGRVHR